MRNVIEAATSLIHASDDDLGVIVRHDPDCVRDVAAALIGRQHRPVGCGAADCVNACDGDYTHETCPNAIQARAKAGA